MNTKIRHTFRAGVLLLVVVMLLGLATASQREAQAGSALSPVMAPQVATLPAETCSYDGLTNTRTCELWATTGDLLLPEPLPNGNTTVPIWGYTNTDPTVGGVAQLPGPALIVNQDEIVEVILHNNLTQPTAMVFPGQALVPDVTGVDAGGTGTYTFTATNPGTYLYEAGLLPNAQHQVAMGLFGALIVRPVDDSGIPITSQAYADSTTAFDDEALLVLSEIDPALNTSATPSSFDMRDYDPKYRLINGQAYPATPPIVIPSPAAGRKVLLRYVNAGLQHHTMGLLGVDQAVLAKDAGALTYPRQAVAETIGTGTTADTLVTMPASADAPGGTRYALYDTSLLLHNNGAAGFGGMLTFVTVSDGAPPTTGPATTSVDLGPNPTDGTVDVTLSAIIPGATSAEYFIGSQGADGSGNPMSPGAGTNEWSAIILAANLPLESGDHTIFVHGSNGTWGAFNFAILHLDKLGPVTSGIALAPNPSDGSVDVNLSATGDDSATGNSNITAAEYFIGTIGANGTGTPLTVNVAAPVASLDDTIAAATMTGLAEGAHPVSVHSQDVFGHWGDYDIATLVVDQTGPTTSNVVADPNPNNGSTPYNPTVAAVRVDATLRDPLISPDVNSTIVQAEGFINTIGADGNGFPLTPADGLFDEPVEDAYVYIPLTTISQLGVGTHQIYVHGQDTSGNWGATDFVAFVIETDSPTVTGTAVNPDTTDGTVLVALTATASDPTSAIVLAEWFTGADPGNGNGTPMIVTADGAVWDLAATIDTNGWAAGDYTISVRARDAAGNWSATDSTILTVTDGPPPEPTIQIYFSTVGGNNNAAVPGVADPDDADVYLWDEAAMAFSRVLDGTADAGLPNNANIDGLAYDPNAGPGGGLFYLSFDRNQGTNVPGLGQVQDEDVVTYNPEDGQWELFFAGVDVCDGMDASNDHDIDAFDHDGVTGFTYFSTAGNATVSGAVGPFDDANIYLAGAGAGCSRLFDAVGAGLPANANIDGLSVVDADTFYMSFLEDTNVPVIGLVQDEDVVLYDAGTWSLFFDGTAQGLTNNGQDLDAVDVE